MTTKAFFEEMAGSSDTFSVPPSKGEIRNDKGFHLLTKFGAWAVILLLVYILIEIGGKAIPAMKDYGLGFLTSTTWDANRDQFGILPEIWGTLYTSFIALLIGGFCGVTIAIFLTQNFLPPKLEKVFQTIIELLAAIPSVVYGLWGIFVLIPFIRPVCNFLHATLGWIPFFGSSLAGPGVAPASLVLAIMILPTIAAISKDALMLVPAKVKEAAYGMGTTRWEAILKVMLPTAKNGIFGALILGLGRALGETMALAMLVGNSNQIALSLFAPANTLAALLASNFPEAGELETQVLMYAALTLLVLTLLVNVAGQLVINLTSSERGLTK
jgi:phosphate transport system permease protein